MVYQHTESKIQGAEKDCQIEQMNSPSKFTPQQIEDFCEAMDSIAKQFPGSDAEKTAQIIRQLQGKLNEAIEDLEMEGVNN